MAAIKFRSVPDLDISISHRKMHGSIPGILCSSWVPVSYTHLGFFDTDVTTPISFENINELEKIIPYGGGGTDFTVVFHYCLLYTSRCV